MPPVGADAADGFRHPGGVAGKQLVIGGGAQEAHHAQLHDEMIDDLLDLAFGIAALGQILFGVDIQEGGDPADGHGGAVLLLDRGEVAEIQPLDGFLGILGGHGNVEPVGGGHALQGLQGPHLLGQFLPQADGAGVHDAEIRVVPGMLLLLDEMIHAVQGHAAIVTDDPAPAVGVGQAGDDPRLPGGPHLFRIHVEHAVVVGLAVLEHLFDFRIQLPAIGFQGAPHHPHAAEGHDGAAEGLGGLQADYLLLLPVDVAGGVGVDAGDGVGIDVVHAAPGGFRLHQGGHRIPQGLGARGGGREEALIPVVGGVVAGDEVPHIDVFLPIAGFKFAHGATYPFASQGNSRRGGSAAASLCL